MDALRVSLIFVCCFLSSLALDGDELSRSEQNGTAIELFPRGPAHAGQTRMPRTLFKKLHSGAAFLTGLKLGAILSKKGFELGHGKIASAHSFQIFGKSVNSAMSLSYGSPDSLLPLVDDVPEGDGAPKRSPSKKADKDADVFHVTVIESPDKPQEAKEEGGEEKKSENVILLYQDAVEEESQTPEAETTFLEEHNKRVKEFNESLLRRANSKF